MPAKRHECAAAVADNAMYLLGGRGDRPVNRYSFTTNTWDSVANMPIVMNHFQAATYKDEIIVAGAFTGGYPHEKPVADIYAFNTRYNTWRIETAIPANRQRGAAACLVHKDKLYLIAGITDGHYDGHVAWLDVYDFKTKKWGQLADAPHARDHFQAVILNNRIYVAGGRRSSAVTKQVFQLTVPEVDVYDMRTNTWSTLDTSRNIPTQRAGSSSVRLGKKAFMVIGGESGLQGMAHAEAEIYDIEQQQWIKDVKLIQGRHGTQAVWYKGKIFVAAGSANKGGGPELNTMEVCSAR